MSTDSRTASPSPLTVSKLLPDEAALKRAFEAEVASCLTSAKSQLGDAPGLAPRVVETAFVQAWNQRATIGTMEQMKVVLADEIRHGSARALSRRLAAGRFAGGKATTGQQHSTASEAPADMWAHIEKAIRTTGTEAHAAADAAGRHEAASHMKSVAKKKSWAVPITILVVAVAISVGGVIYVDRLGEDDAALGATSNAGIQPISSTVGQIGTVKLGDGSGMRIGPDTKIFIADGFPTKIRALKVDGTAEFTVAPAAAGTEKALPFHVVAKRNHIIATGTKFVVSAYANDSGVMVLSKEGTVTVKTGKLIQNLAANQAVVIDKGAFREPTAEERDQAFGWVDGQISIQHKPLRVVVAALQRWFNFDVKVPDLPLLDRDASINVPLDSSRLAITQVEKSANVKFGFEGDNRLFRDAAKNAAAKPAAAKPAAAKKK